MNQTAINKVFSPTAHLEIISNGMGAPSMKQLQLAAEGKIQSRISITADMQSSEEDMLWSTGERTSSRDFWERVVQPFCAKHGIEAYLVRPVDKNGRPLPPLWEAVKRAAKKFSANSSLEHPQKAFIPLFGSHGGRLRQSCTQRYKVAAIRQQARRLGAQTIRTAQGIHFDEAKRRVKGIHIGRLDGWITYYDVNRNEQEEPKLYQISLLGEPVAIKGPPAAVPVKWATHCYPLVELRLNREAIRRDLDRSGIPYLISTECHHCPHKDLDRWLRTSPKVLRETARVEAQFGGEFFFTDERIPLLEAITMKQRRSTSQSSVFDGGGFACTDGMCGV